MQAVDKGMEIKKFLSTDKVLGYLENEVDDAAKALGVFSIDSQIWEDENSPRNGFLGYAMQQETDFQSFSMDNEEVYDRPETRILVTEFLELMDQIRYSTGITQLYANTKSNSFFPEESPLFWMHYNNALITSSIASDRIRDFAIVGVLEQTSRHYAGKYYIVPFQDIEKYLKDLCAKKELGGITEELMRQYAKDVEALPKHAEDIARLRKKRNSIVHDLSTRSAKELKQRVELPQNQSKDSSTNRNCRLNETRHFSVTEVEKRMLEQKTRIMKELGKSMDELKQWYLLLEKVGDLVFQAEYMISKWKNANQA
jgi:hypothetical protein